MQAAFASRVPTSSKVHTNLPSLDPASSGISTADLFRPAPTPFSAYTNLLAWYQRLVRESGPFPPYQPFWPGALRLSDPRHLVRLLLFNVRGMSPVSFPGLFSFEVPRADELLGELLRFNPVDLKAIAECHRINTGRMRQRLMWTWFVKGVPFYAVVIALAAIGWKHIPSGVQTFLAEACGGAVAALFPTMLVNASLCLPMLGLLVAFDDVLRVALVQKEISPQE